VLERDIHAPRSEPLEIQDNVRKSKPQESFNYSRRVRYYFVGVFLVDFNASKTIVVSDFDFRDAERHYCAFGIS